MKTQNLVATGHLIDSGILAGILNLIVREKGDYRIIHFDIGKTNLDESTLELELLAENTGKLNLITEQLIQHGCYEKKPPFGIFKPSEKDQCVPDDFYSSTNHRTEVYTDESWKQVNAQRMDGVIINTSGKLICRKLRDVKRGDLVLCGSESVHVFPPSRERGAQDFGFMSNEVSSERSAEFTMKKIASEMKRLKTEGKKVIVIAGPVVVHSGGADAFAGLIREGFIHGLLSGNALAVHDMESVFFGTSLGICQKTGKPTHEGHKNHMKAINRINTSGSIGKAVEEEILTRGIMYETVKSGIPYCLAGSIRDDGPLPETETDMITAQGRYAEIIKDASLVLMLSTMLHSIGAGNMMPSWIPTVCVDINPVVVTKLADRGSSQAVGVVSDVGLFLKALAEECGIIIQ